MPPCRWRFAIVLLIVSLSSSFATLPLVAAPPTAPILRIETGMHIAPIRRIDVDSAERFLVTGSDDKTARVWSLEDGSLLATLRPPIGPGNEGKIFAAAITPDGELIATGGWTSRNGLNTSIYLFNRRTGRLERQIKNLPNVIYHLTFSQDGSRIAATLGDKNGVQVFNVASGEKLFHDTDYEDRSFWADFDTHGRLVTSCSDGRIRLYDANYRRIAEKHPPGNSVPSELLFLRTENRSPWVIKTALAWICSLAATSNSFVVSIPAEPIEIFTRSPGPKMETSSSREDATVRAVIIRSAGGRKPEKHQPALLTAPRIRSWICTPSATVESSSELLIRLGAFLIRRVNTSSGGTPHRRIRETATMRFAWIVEAGASTSLSRRSVNDQRSSPCPTVASFLSPLPTKALKAKPCWRQKRQPAPSTSPVGIMSTPPSSTANRSHFKDTKPLAVSPSPPMKEAFCWEPSGTCDFLDAMVRNAGAAPLRAWPGRST